MMVMDADHDSAELSLPHSESFANQGDLLTPAEEPGSSSSSSSSSTGSSLSASFFRLDERNPHEDDRSVASLSVCSELPSKEVTNDAFPPSESLPSLSAWEQMGTEATQSFQFPSTLSEDIPNDSQPNSEEFRQEWSGSTQDLNEVHSGQETLPGSPGSVSTPTSIQTESMMQSPSVQVMERSAVSSTYRIPSHVFERSKSTNPAEWSVASNESLFSIQVGNNSFSRDYVFRAGRSGELFSPTNPEEYVYTKSRLSTIAAVDAENRGSGLEEDLDLLDTEAAKTTMDVNGATEDRNKPRVQIVEPEHNSSSPHSEGSGTNAHSFPFPKKKRKKRKKTCEWLCCCFKCCQPCYDCAWPSCSCFKSSPGCCNCAWPSCSCSNSSPGCCDCAWPSCSCPKCSLDCCNCAWPSCSRSKYSSTSCNTWSCCSCSNSTPSCCHCGLPSCSFAKWCQGCSHCSCSNCCQPCSCCAWPSCSSCFSCRPCCDCKWPSCNCCSCSSCKWPSCPCSSCSLMCCKWPWTSCFGTNCCRCCRFKRPTCSLPDCSGCCCHCTGIDRRCSVHWFSEGDS